MYSLPNGIATNCRMTPFAPLGHVTRARSRFTLSKEIRGRHKTIRQRKFFIIRYRTHHSNGLGRPNTLHCEVLKSGVFAVQVKSLVKMPVKRIRTKSCARCQKTSDVLYRVRIDESQEWIFVCPVCLEEVKPNNPRYQYGGTWKSKKRH